MLAALLLLNVLGFVRPCADWYTARVYPVLTEPLSRVSALVPCAVGEVVMLVGVLALIASALLLVLLVFLRKHRRFRGFARRFLKSVLACVLVVALLFTLNWAIPFRATPLREALQVSQAAAESQEETLAHLEDLRARVCAGMNEAATAVTRDANGDIVYASTQEENAQVAYELQGLGAEFPQLSGFYPAPKAALISDVLEWMGIGGYTYPYTQEITYNVHVSQLYYPLLAAHESVHHKGYFMESDAEFLAFLALSRSDEAVLRYSAYESMYSYVDRAYRAALVAAYGAEEAQARYEDETGLSERVVADLERDQEQRDAAYEATVNKGAETALSNAAESASEYGWSAQANVLQDNTYSGVVGLLLAYYY